MPARLHLPGRVFGRLTAVRAAGRYTLCVCSCGTEKLVRTDRLTSGKTRSCGCLLAEMNAAAKRPVAPPAPRPPARTPAENRLATLWNAMHQRCYNPNNGSYAAYGGRGITVAPEWHDCAKFIADMLPLYTPGHWLDRVDNDGPYSADNCRFTTPRKSAGNRRNTLRFFDGKTLQSFASHHGVPYMRAYTAFSKVAAREDGRPFQEEVLEELGLKK